jgi:DNA invertase Pin-like site-specific DNA recombinase
MVSTLRLHALHHPITAPSLPATVTPGVAEFETAIRKERQLEGIAKAKVNGIYKGRKPSIDVVRVRAMRDAGRSPTAIARELNVARSSIYRVLG